MVRSLALCAVVAHLVACATQSASVAADEPTLVSFSEDSLSPATVHIATNGNVSWENHAEDTQGYVVFPATIAEGFTCGGNLAPYFQRTETGYQSLPLTTFASERVELPCPLRPGTYDYEVWILDAGFAKTTPEGDARKLRGRIVVE
jgi:hypothetical protein